MHREKNEQHSGEDGVGFRSAVTSMGRRQHLPPWGKVMPSEAWWRGWLGAIRGGPGRGSQGHEIGPVLEEWKAQYFINGGCPRVGWGGGCCS